jgi:hypothetical protein
MRRLELPAEGIREYYPLLRHGRLTRVLYSENTPTSGKLIADVWQSLIFSVLGLSYPEEMKHCMNATKTIHDPSRRVV